MAVWVAGLSVTAQGAVLGQVDFTEQLQLLPDLPSTSISLHFAYSVAPLGPTDLKTVIFDSFEFVDDDDGRLVTLTSNADDPEFQAYVAHATNRG